MRKRKKFVVIFIMLITLMMVLTTQTKSTDQEGVHTTQKDILTEQNTKAKYICQELRTIDGEEICIDEKVKTEEETVKDKTIVELTQNELETFYRLVFAEDGIEDEECQVAVAAVFLNRMLSEYYSDDFFEVLNQTNAFSCVKDGKIYLMTENPYEVTLDMVPEVTKRAVKRALNGEDPIEEMLIEEAQRLGLSTDYYAADGALYYYNPKACSQKAINERANIQVKVKLGEHYYYKVWG